MHLLKQFFPIAESTVHGKCIPPKLLSFPCSLCLIVLLITGTVSSRGSVINALSPALFDVSAAVKSAAENDIVVIPAGSARWTSTLNVTKGITLQGSTTVSGDHTSAMTANDATTITDGTDKSNSAVAIFVQLGSSSTFRMTGITLIGGGVGGVGYNGSVNLKGKMTSAGIHGSISQVRIDHCHFLNLNDKVAIVDTAIGVIDHNLVDMAGGPSGANYTATRNGFVSNMSYWNGVSGYGDGSWNDLPYFGTKWFLFLEDNTLNNGYVNDIGTGGRMVIRYNTINSGVIQLHNGPARQRSGRCLEIYNNTMIWQPYISTGAPWSNLIQIRAGSGVIWGNISTGYDNLVTSWNDRSQSGRYIPEWGFATGSNPWDQNNDQYGYASLDQVGRGKGDLIIGDTPVNSTTGTPSWPHQASEPWYEWNNKWTQPKNDPGTKWSNQNPTVIQQSRDYFLDTQMPGYTSYTYPHPLIGTHSVPRARQNLRVGP